MMSRNGNDNFFRAHYDWLIALAGILALAGAVVYFVSGLGSDVSAAADDALARVKRMKPAETGVTAVDLGEFATTLRFMRSPRLIAEIQEKKASFLSSERRVKCKCGKAIPGDVEAFPKCPFCGEKQLEEKLVVIDADADGLPDEWERKYSLNPGDASDASADSDKDGFTNMEEFKAGTDPSDPNDHPDYFDSLKIIPPLKETRMPFVFRRANKIPAGWRLEFFDPKRKDDYNRIGTTITALIGEQIADTGFKVRQYIPKTAKEPIPGTEGLTRTVDASEAEVERISDGKLVKMGVQRGRKLEFAPIEVQAKLSYERGGKTFDVIAGSKISLHSDRYRIVEIKSAGNGVEIEFENEITGKKRKLAALE